MNSPRTDSQELCGTWGAELEGLELWPKLWGPRLWQALLSSFETLHPLPLAPPPSILDKHCLMWKDLAPRSSATPNPNHRRLWALWGQGCGPTCPWLCKAHPGQGLRSRGPFSRCLLNLKKHSFFIFVSKLRHFLCTPRQCVFLSWAPCCLLAECRHSGSFRAFAP